PDRVHFGTVIPVLTPISCRPGFPALRPLEKSATCNLGQEPPVQAIRPAPAAPAVTRRIYS
ncbi:MAG: hypothetical protein ACR2O0_00935, partial [Rhizobiaceae bacterium]